MTTSSAIPTTLESVSEDDITTWETVMTSSQENGFTETTATQASDVESVTFNIDDGLTTESETNVERLEIDEVSTTTSERLETDDTTTLIPLTSIAIMTT